MNLQGAEPELSALCNDDEIYERKFSVRSFASKSNKFCFCLSVYSDWKEKLCTRSSFWGLYGFSDFDVSVLNHF